MVESTETFVDYVQQFKNFIENFRSKEGALKYYERIWNMIRMGQRSLIVDFDDLILFDPVLAEKVLDNPAEVIEAFSQAVQEIIMRENPEYAKHVKRFYVRLRNPPKIMKIRELSSDYIGKLVTIEGIVTRVTRVDAKLVKAVFRHVTELGEHEFEYPPEGVIVDRVEKPPYCLVCHKPGKCELVIEKSSFVDWQKIVVQEKPEEVPGGQIPRSIEAILTGDIVDSTRPGDRVIVTGILKVQPLTGLSERRTPRSVFSFYIDVIHIEVQEKILEEIVITREDEEKIWELARDPWIREKIVSSIAPGIYGYWDVKKAIALLLFGGTPKILSDGTRIRGDIHVLITGDPGTAKSQLLQFAARIAPRGLYTSGKGSTAAGLTATVLRDKTTGEYYLEAGALVLADGGVACLHPDTRILVDNEYVRIGELFNEEKVVKAVSKGEPVELNYINYRVVGLSESYLKPTEALSTIIRRKPWKGKLIKLTFESGYEIMLTPDHLLMHGDTLEWKPAREFKPGDTVLSVLKIPSHNEDVYILDIVPDDWMIVIEDYGDKEGFLSMMSGPCGVWQGTVFYDSVRGKFYVSVETLRRLLKGSCKHVVWKNRILKFSKGGKDEALLVPKITPELGYLMGFVCARGRVVYNRGKGRILVLQPAENREYVARLVGIVKKVTGKKPRVCRLRARSAFSNMNTGENTYLGVLISSYLLAYIVKYFTEDGFRRLLKLPDDVLRAFIAGLLDASGLTSVERTVEEGSCKALHIGITLEDADKAKAVSLALRRFDIYSRIKRIGGVAIVEITEVEDALKLIELVKPFSLKARNLQCRSYALLPKEEYIPRKLSMEIAKALNNARLSHRSPDSKGCLWSIYDALREKTLTRDALARILNYGEELPQEAVELINMALSRDYYLDRIVKVELVDYEGYVYDLYVPGVHNFLAEGIVVHNCIDEIDKMREEDRSAIHEALEQQTVSIAKAGIVARLNARTSVLAAGNPKYGRYDPTQPVSKNIDLPPTILSRFDLIFIIQDIPNAEHDRRLAKHILGIHTETERAKSFIDPQLLKKYIGYAKRYIRPQLTPEAAKLIEEFYVNLRQASLTAGEGGPSAIAITPRQLEALIRLTEAYAKMALKTRATLEDAEEAIRLMMSTLSKVGFDIESGKIDIDILETGISASRREKKKKFMSFLSRLLDEVGGEIELNELYAKAKEEGFEKDFVMEVINELYKSGEVYYPRPGKIAKVK